MTGNVVFLRAKHIFFIQVPDQFGFIVKGRVKHDVLTLGLLLPGRLVHPHPLLFRLQQTNTVRRLSVSSVNYCVKNYKKYETVTVGLFTVGPLPHSAL